LMLLWEETAPVYGDLALTKLQQSLVPLQESAATEFSGLRTSLADNAESRVTAALQRLSRKHQTRLVEFLPTLATAEGAEELGTRWMEGIEGDLEQIVLHFHDQYSEDLGDLVATLEQFPTDDVEQMSEDELLRQFAHLWLIKMDRWVLLEGEDDTHER